MECGQVFLFVYKYGKSTSVSNLQNCDGNIQPDNKSRKCLFVSGTDYAGTGSKLVNKGLC